MDRKDIFDGLAVGQADADGWFDRAEAADWNINKDFAIYGVLSGLVATLGAAPTVDITSGVGIDKNGKRLRAYTDGAGTKNFSFANATDGSATSVTAGNERWISVFARHGRKKTDPRTDDAAATVYYDQVECLNSDDGLNNFDKFFLVKGAEAALGAGVKPSLDAGAILICDIKRTNADGANVLDTGRREIWNIPADRAVGTGSGMALLMAALSNWLGGRTNTAQTHLTAQLDKIITDLAATSASDDGAERIGAAAVGNLAAGSVRSQLDELDTEKGGLATSNTWTLAQVFSALATFSAGATLTSAAGNPAVRVTDAADGNLLKVLDIGGQSQAKHLRIYLSTGTTGSWRKGTLIISWNAAFAVGATTMTADALGGSNPAWAFVMESEPATFWFMSLASPAGGAESMARLTITGDVLQTNGGAQLIPSLEYLEVGRGGRADAAHTQSGMESFRFRYTDDALTGSTIVQDTMGAAVNAGVVSIADDNRHGLVWSFAVSGAGNFYKSARLELNIGL